jgi:hypothetical protein
MRIFQKRKPMKAIEFRAEIKNGVIHLPKEYQSLADQSARIILLTEETSAPESKQSIDELQTILDKLTAKQMFQEIENPVIWQQNLRDAWNERTD